MRRHALLLNASNAIPSDLLPGATADADNFASFLKSDAGGAWNDNEVEILDNGSSYDVLANFALRCRNADYCVVGFFGHASYSEPDKECHLALGPEDLIPESRLKNGLSKCLLILDTCRGVETAEEAAKYARAAASVRSSEPAVRQAIRSAYDKHVLRNPRSSTTLYACNVGEFANDDAEGGFYTQALIEHSAEWAYKLMLPQSPEILDVKQAHDLAAPKVTARSSQQNPQISHGRRNGIHFPFAVRYKQ